MSMTIQSNVKDKILAAQGEASKVTYSLAEIKESRLTGPELVQETTDKVVLIKERIKVASDRHKSYANNMRPFKILERIGHVAYRLIFPQELSSVHDTIHVSNLKKCLADANLHVPLEEIKVDKTLRFVEEPIKIMDREFKKLKRSRILIVKVRWNSKRGPEFTWEREDFMKAKYQKLFDDRASLRRGYCDTCDQTSDYDCEIRYHPGKTNVVADALSRKEIVKPRRVTYSLAEIGESRLTGPELVQETNDKVVLINERIKVASDHHKSYANNMRKSLEFKVYDQVLLKVSLWKGVVWFGKKGKLAPRYVGLFEILERIGHVAYRLIFPQELSSVHDTIHVSNLKKCLVDANLHVPLEEIKVDKTLHFVEEPIEIMDHEFKKLKRSRIPIVKVCWNSKRGPEFTWEREDFMKAKYPKLFDDRADENTG
nr:putative reverse transcriptase domain-containing protein [Tanacetum cinerariifolium]